MSLPFMKCLMNFLRDVDAAPFRLRRLIMQQPCRNPAGRA
jgi:hypothetical protein